MPEFEIETDVPPPSANGRKRYPFAKMEVGHSFVVDSELAESARTAAIHWGKNHGRKFKTQRQPDRTLRIWRAS